MKKNLLLALFYIISTGLCFRSSAQAPDYLWAKSSGEAGHEQSYRGSVDASGNIIIVGSFQSATITFGTTVLTNAGWINMYVVKYDPNGNVLWAKSAGGGSSDNGYGCTFDASGNIIVTGDFDSDSIIFGSTILVKTSSSAPDMFVVKYDPNGNVLWAKSATGGYYGDQGSACATDSLGNIIITGWFNSNYLHFDTTMLSKLGSTTIFIVKYDPNGNVLWAKAEGGTGVDLPLDCKVDANNNILITGGFDSPAITFGTTTLINSGSRDFFIVKYDSNGNVLWANSAGGFSQDNGMSCSTDANQNVIATGYFIDSIRFGTTVLTNPGFADMFVVKYDSGGNVLWAKDGGNAFGRGCTTDALGNIIVTGDFFGQSITFDTTTFINSDPTGMTGDIFIVDYDASGNVRWAKSTGGAYEDLPRDCFIDTSGNLFVTGIFKSPTITFGTNALTNSGSFDMFIVKLEADQTIGINQIPATENKILLFPNPAADYINIVLSNKSKDVVINIIDYTGKLIYKSQVINHNSNSEKIEVNTKDFAEGIYLVRIQSSTFSETKSVVILKN